MRPAARLAKAAAADPAGPTTRVRPERALDELVANLRGYTAASDREEQAYADLVAKVAPAPVYKVPLLETDVHDLSGLAAVCDLLFDRSRVVTGCTAGGHRMGRRAGR